MCGIDGPHSEVAVSGFTTIQHVTSGNEVTGSIHYKIAGSSELSSYTVTWTGGEKAHHYVATFRGLETSTPNGPDIGAAEAHEIGDLIIAIFAGDRLAGVLPVISTPSGRTETSIANATNNAGAGFIASAYDVPTTDGYTVGTFTYSGSTTSAMRTAAFKPV